MIHQAKLITITPDAEKLIAHTARVSSPHQRNEKIEGLLKYCVKHHHWSIFEMATMTVEITTTRAIAPQILRHRSACFQEFSQRYAEPGQVSDNPLPNYIDAVSETELRLQDYKNRQNSFETEVTPEIAKLQARLTTLALLSETLYEDMISAGIAKESARGALLLNTPTRLYMSNNIRNWIHYLNVRCDKATQKEHRLIADSIKEIFKQQLPTIAGAAFNE